MTITLRGFSLSNYGNKVKRMLLESGIAFEEQFVATGGAEAVLEASPLGKIPFLRTPQEALCESVVIVEQLEQVAPSPALTPADAWAAAKVRGWSQFIELHLELVARELYSQTFYSGTVGESHQARVPELLDRRSQSRYQGDVRRGLLRLEQPDVHEVGAVAVLALDSPPQLRGQAAAG